MIRFSALIWLVPLCLLFWFVQKYLFSSFRSRENSFLAVFKSCRTFWQLSSNHSERFKFSLELTYSLLTPKACSPLSYIKVIKYFIMPSIEPVFTCSINPVNTGPSSAVANVSGNRIAKTDASLTADPGVASSIPARSHTFVVIDHGICSTIILLPSAESFKKGCCQLQAKACARSTG